MAPTRHVDVVFEGGATLGAAYIGSLNLMERARIGFSRIAGNSAGAITAVLVGAGYRAAEVEWLMSNVSNPRVARPANLQPSLQPIDFMDLLDIPRVSQISQQTMRKTQLWKALKGSVVDQVLRTPVPIIRTRTQMTNDIMSGLVNVIGSRVAATFDRPLRDMLAPILQFLPTTTPRLSDLSLFDETAGLRTAFADSAWQLIATNFPLFLMSTNFLHEGGVFEGEKFRTTIDGLLRARVGSGGPVQFRDLNVPMAIIAYDFGTKARVIYSTVTHPTMEVAEAVRRSMSIPLLWQPRKRDPFNSGNASTETIVDGGLASNFPIWLFTAVGDEYWPPASIDPSRPTIGLSLDETKAAPLNWNASSGKFAIRNHPSPPHVDFWTVVRPVLVAKLKEAGLAVPNEASISAELDDLTYLKVIFGAFGADKEQIMRKEIVTQLMSGKEFYDVVIPVLGFHGFDFSVNSDRDDIDAIAERGFLAARDALSKRVGGQAILQNPGGFPSPY